MDPSLAVLIVDDDADTRTIVERTLSRAQLEVLAAASGGEALDLYEKYRPALVIADWLMPDLSGIDLCRQIRSKQADLYTYIIILTGIAEKEKLVLAFEAGADDYLTKPFHPDELLARVRVGQRLAELQRALAEKSRWLEQLSLTDPLTGIPNRRAVEEWTLRELHSASRRGHGLWLVMADLDHFKRVNDTHGHLAGDAVLKEFAQILRDNTRQGDFFGRVGGEEFVLILREGDKTQALAVVERIRQAVERREFPFEGRSIRVTASFGVAGYPGGEPTAFPKLWAQADSALYQAKQSGRNRIGVADW